MSPDDRFERLLAELLDASTPSRPPDRLVPETLRAVRRVPRWPRWLAYVKEPPMRVSSRVAVGSPTARVSAFVAATLLLAVLATGAVVGATSLLSGPAVLIVAQDGTGTHETIAEAVAAAEDGDTIMVRPGVYTEAVVVNRDITIEGDGPREDIVIEAPADGPRVLIAQARPDEDPYALLLRDTKAKLFGLTFRGEPSAVVASGGAPTLGRLAFDRTGVLPDASRDTFGGHSVIVNRGSTAIVRDNELSGGGPIGVYDGSSPLIEGNVLSGGSGILGGPGDGTVIRDNHITDAVVRAIGIGFFGDPAGAVTIERNVIENAGHEAIDARTGSLRIVGNTIIEAGSHGINTGSAADAHIEGNRITGAGAYGINIESTSGVAILANTLVDNAVGVALSHGTVHDNSLRGNGIGISLAGEAEVSGNEIADGETGLFAGLGSPVITGNVINGHEQGLVVAIGTTPLLSGNTICDNGRNIVTPDGIDPPDTTGNEICPDALADAAR